MTSLTPAQQKALDWLPSNGAWRMDAGKFASGLSSLCLFHRDIAAYEYGDFGPRGGRCIRWRLTPKGIAYKAGRKG